MSNLFFRYPRLTLLAIGFILLSGISSLITLPRQEDPTMAERFGTVETFLPGASASRVETLITEKLEIALLTVPEIKTIDSVSRPGHSIISVELHDSVPRQAVDLVWTEIRDEVAGVRAQLPVDAAAPEIESRGPLGDTLTIGLLSTETPLAIMERIAIELESRLAAMPGTKETRIRGMPEQQITVNMDPWAMARSNIAIDELARVIGRSDTKRPAGRISGSDSDIVVEVKGDLSGTERISSIPVRELDDGTFLRVGDIASVRKSYADPPRTLAIVNGERAIVVSTTMETGRRVDQWVSDVKEIVAAYEAELPDMVRFVTIVDQNVYTNDRLTQLALNLVMAVILVLAVLFVLMGLRSALIVGAALPLTIAMVLAGLSALNIPLHQMSVTGLIIALGLLIDNAIVVVEEYKKNRRTGLETGQAISTAVSHLAVPLLASTTTTAFAFLPIATTPGGVGDFTGTMAVCVVLSVSSSFLLALTIIPAVAGFIDQRWAMHSTRRERWWVNGIHLPGLSELYRRSLAMIVASPWKGIGLSLCLPMAGFLLAQGLTLSFFPPTDRNQFQVQINLPPSASIESTRDLTGRVRDFINAQPEVLSSQWFIGEGAPRVYYNMLENNDGVSSFANGFVTTRHIDDPRAMLPDLQRRLMSAFPQARVMALPFEQGPPFSAPIEVRIVGPDLNRLKEIGDDIRLTLSRIKGVTYTTSTLSESSPQLSVYPNENLGRRLGFSKTDIPSQINGSISGFIAGTVMEGDNQIPVRVRLAAENRNSISDLDSAPLVSGLPREGYGGVPLEQLARLSLEPSPNRIVRYQGERTNVVSGFLLPYTIPSVPLEEFRQLLASSSFSLPTGYRIEFGGEAEERGQAVSNIVSTFVMYLWLMVAVVVLSLNSFRYAGVIGITGLLSIGLALFGVWLSGYPMGYMAFIGTLGLVGLAINGSIIVLSALKADAAACGGDETAMIEVVCDSTRHIVSTTLTTIAGFIPLILFGGHFWPPLAMAIAGGVAGSAILALYLVPAMFARFMRNDQARAADRSLAGQAAIHP